MPQRRRSAGFTYLGLIILVAILGLVGAAGLKVGSLLQRNAAEQALLDIGAQFSDALASYAAATPAGQPPQPPSLKQLLNDPRFPSTRRHLRQIFVDPVTGKAGWGVIYLAGDVGVLGIYSLSNAQPLKVGNFEQRFQGFEGKTHYSDWKFIMAAKVQAAPPMPAPPLTAPAAVQKTLALSPAAPALPTVTTPVASPAPAEPVPEPVLGPVSVEPENN